MSRKKSQPPRGSSSAAAASLGREKRIAFTIITVLVPIALVLITELSLRAAGYGGNLDLVIKRKIAGREFYSINRSVARRYFAQEGVVVPEPSEDLFAITKDSNTKRIFCLGESSMAGFPYEFNATAPSFLRDRLQQLLPQYRIEMVNVGLSAVGSYVIRDFIGELMKYQPDLIVLYLGHNEFYGVYGVGSAVHGRSLPWLTRLMVSLYRFKTYLLVRDGVAAIRQIVSSGTDTKGGTLMQQMVGSDEIPYGGDLYRAGREIYRNNLHSILSEAEDRHVPVLVSALVSNVRDIEPFRSVPAPEVSQEQYAVCRGLLDSAATLESSGRTAEAREIYRRVTTIDTCNANAFFRLGRLLLAQGHPAEAGQALVRAKDLDALRFRISEDFQADLISVAQSLNVPVARPDSAFQSSSPDGIVGHELILEHLHPNLHGYFLMAKCWTKAIAGRGMLAPAGAWQWSRDLSDQEYLALSATTPFDSLQGAIKVDLLTHRWPFPTTDQSYKYKPSGALQELVYRYIQGTIPWSDARYQASEYFAARKEYENARQECRGIAKVIPFAYQPYLRIADYFRMEGKNEEAKQAYDRCLQIENNPFARLKLAIILLEQNKPSEARDEIEQGLALDFSKGGLLPRNAVATARYMLGVAYAKLGQIPTARENLERALSIDPGFGEARILLQQLPK